MSITPHPDLLQAGVSPGSVQTVSSRLRPAPSSNPMASKRVCFYKSGDPQFGGLRMVINGRTFKHFDALLDALSKKVPLPFGVRTITTPRGTNSIRALEELQDGGSYVCSDQKRVKPLNLEQANRRQVPWNTTRPISAWRRGHLRPIPRRTDVGIRPGKMIDRTIAVRTPKRLVVYKNRDPTVKRIVVLQRRIAPTFDALLDYLSQVMQFPVVKLFTPDGRRVEGLAGLILCSGVVVVAGTEPFRLSNFNFQGGATNPTQSAFPMERVRAPTQIYQDKKKSLSSSTRSRKFSLSSERYFVNQIKKSLSESLSEHESHHSGSLGTDLNRPSESVDMEPCECMSGVNRKDCPTMPTEDDIEKSFRVNQDGSMTVEMKVRLTLKQEEMIHWTTTLSRTSTSCQSMGACTSHPVSGPNSPDASNESSRHAGGQSTERASERSRRHTSTGRTVAFKEQVGQYCSRAKAEMCRNLKHSRRTPTPGPRHVQSHSTSVENITTVTETGVQESTVGTYSYMEHTSEGDVTEGYCVVSRSSASSIRPVPKPRKMGSGEGKKSKLYPAISASGVSDVLEMHNSGVNVTETVKHIYETQPQGKPGSTDSGPCSSNNDCDVDLTRRSTASESPNGKKDEMFSLSSGSVPPQQQSKTKLTTRHSESTAHKFSSAHEDIRNKSVNITKRTVTSRTQKKASPLPSRSDKRQRNTMIDSSKTRKKTSSPDNVAKTRSSSESAQNKKISRVKKNEKKNGTSASKSTISALSTEQGLNLDEGTVRDLSHNLNNTKSEKPKKPYRKNVQDILTSLPPGHTKKTILKQKSMNDETLKSPKRSRELSESISMPLLCSTPPVQQYVETWLQQVQPGRVPYMEELHLTETEKDTLSVGSDLSKGTEKKTIFEIPCKEEGSWPAEDVSVGIHQQQLVQVQGEGEQLDDEPEGTRAFCRSMPSVQIHPADQDCKTRMHKSTEALFPLESEPPNDVVPNFTGGMKPIVQQLCLSLQSIRRAASPMLPASLEKTRSLPDFSGQVASVFGASSTKFLSFLSVTTLKDGSGSHGSQLSLNSDRNNCPEALKVMQSLEKLVNTEDEQQLRASLSDLRNSTSPRFQESWREFQEKYDIGDNPLLSPKNSEQEFILEVYSEAGDQKKERAFDIEQLMEELSSVSEELRQELSSLAEGEVVYHDSTEPLSGATDKALHPDAPYDSSTITDNDLKNSEFVETMSTAEIKEENETEDQITDPTSEENTKGSLPAEECSLESHFDTTESLTGPRKGIPHLKSEETCSLKEGEINSGNKATKLPSEHSEKCINTPKGNPVEESSQLKEKGMCSLNDVSDGDELSEAARGMTEIPKPVKTQSASPPANVPEPEASNMANNDLVCSVSNSEQESVASTHKNESPTNDLHGLSTDEQCNTEEAFTDNDTERQEQTTLGYQQYCNCTGVLLSQSEDRNVIPHGTNSSCHHSAVPESKIKDSRLEEPELPYSQDLDEESVAQTEEAASSAEHEHAAPMQKHNVGNSLQALGNVNSPETLSASGSERKSLRSGESTKGQKINRSSQSVKTNKSEQKSSRSQPSIKTTTSSNPGIKKSLSSTKALNVGVATPRSLSPKRLAANEQSSLPAIRKPVTPSNSGRTKQVTKAKPKSVNGDRLKSPKQDLCESASVPFICAPPSDVHQYVEGWLEKMQPEPAICTEGMTHPEAEPQKKAVFQIGPDSSEESEEVSASGHLSPEEMGLSVKENAGKGQPTPHIQIKCEEELTDDRSQRLRGFCKSMPSVHVQPADKDCHTKIHKSTEALFPLESEPPNDVVPNFAGGMKPIVQQLCLSLQSIRRAASPMLPASLEKTHSLPDFSGQVASVFGASSTKFLSFLSVMTLKDGSGSHGSQLSLNSDRNNCPEALKVMQSLEKFVNTEDEQQLRASLSDLRNSTSPRLQQSWREFQEKYDIQDSPIASQKKMEQEFALDVYSETGDQNKDNPCGIEQLMEELSMCEELRQEISSLVEEDDAADCPISTAEEASHVEHGDTNTVITTDDVEGSEAVEVMPVALPDDKASCMNESDLEEIDSTQAKSVETINSVEEQDKYTEKANSMDESHLEEVNSIQTKSVETINSVDEGVRSVTSSNEAESFKCEETGSQIAESEDIDRERFLTPATESEPKDIEKCSDTDHQSEEAKCECSDEDVAGEEKLTNRDSPMDEEDDHMQENESHDESAGNLAQALSSVEDKEDSLKSSNSNKGLSTHSENYIYPNKMEDKRPDTHHNGGTYHPVEFSQELLDFVNKALLSSSLAFTYDCEGNLRVQPEIGEGICVRASMSTDSQYGLKRLPSPCTSDLSDYRPDTADSEACKSQDSFDIATDASIGDEEADKVSQGLQGKADEDCERLYSENSAFSAESGTTTSPSVEKSHATPKSDIKSVCSLKSNQDTASRTSHQDIAYFSTSSSTNVDSESGQCLSFSQTDLSQGVLIDKGRWLLKENHLIRTSPPLATGMYGQLDSSSADSGQDHTSEGAPASQHLNHHSALTVFSSSELEEMAKPPTPKCTYFTIPHGSDSDPFQDDQSSNGSKQGDVMRGNRVSPQEEPPKTWARKNSSFSSFASVEFKLPDGKIHPEGGVAVERPARSQTIGGRTLQEEESTESLQLRCGQNCPIL